MMRVHRKRLASGAAALLCGAALLLGLAGSARAESRLLAETAEFTGALLFLDLQKAGGLQGTFSYTAFAPARGVGVFVAINEFNLAGGLAMMKAANDLITQL